MSPADPFLVDIYGFSANETGPPFLRISSGEMYGDNFLLTQADNPVVPSISFGGLAVLGGLVFAVAIGGLAVQRSRRAMLAKGREASHAA
jgi:hypothetical protein